jgi:mono/diheme cytochrome c family protein
MKTVVRKPAFIAMAAAGLFFTSCGGNETNQTSSSEQPSETTTAPPVDEGLGIGPVKHVDIPATIDPALAAKGKTIFEAKCTACHNTDDQKKVGPGQKGVTQRRKPEWIMNMILNPGEMTQNDPTAKELLATYIAPMANQNLTEEEARAVLEFFRQNDAQ